MARILRIPFVDSRAIFNKFVQNDAMVDLDKIVMISEYFGDQKNPQYKVYLQGAPAITLNESKPSSFCGLIYSRDQLMREWCHAPVKTADKSQLAQRLSAFHEPVEIGGFFFSHDVIDATQLDS